MTSIKAEYCLSAEKLAERQAIVAEADKDECLRIDGANRPLHLDIPFSVLNISSALSELLNESNIKTLNDLRYHLPTDISPPQRKKFGRSSEVELNHVILNCGAWLFNNKMDADVIREQTEKGKEFLRNNPELNLQLKAARAKELKEAAGEAAAEENAGLEEMKENMIELPGLNVVVAPKLDCK